MVQLFVDGQWDDIYEMVLNGYYQQIPDVMKALSNVMTDEIVEANERLTEIQVISAFLPWNIYVPLLRWLV